jgi:hypothetical protein
MKERQAMDLRVVYDRPGPAPGRGYSHLALSHVAGFGVLYDGRRRARYGFDSP